MTSRALGWPLILGSFGLIFGLIVGSAAMSLFGIALLDGPTGPAVGAVLGVVIGLFLE